MERKKDTDTEKETAKILGNVLRKVCLENLTRTGYNEGKWDRVKQRVIYLTNVCK